ncbi:hypothetical protein AB4Y72_14955 [Arthrobacter sp. YAF34]|uniref:hypothetical protein n=1 Tax=Arthrobacter sp. YAF34 TaxID=3233083 RepID=UPI003F93D352
MTGFAIEITTAIDGNEQALRAADAAWEAARWSFWMLVLTLGLLAGAIAAAVYAKKTWESTHKQLSHSNEQLDMARTADLEREATNVAAWLVARNSYINVYVRNGNDGPVYDVRCKVWGKPDGNLSEPSVEVYEWNQMALSPAAAGIEKEKGDQRYSIDEDSVVYNYTQDDIPRTRSGSRVVALNLPEDFRVWNGEPKTTGLAVELSFRDSDGNNWHRAWNGKLSQRTGSS